MRLWIRKSFRNRIFVTILAVTLIPLILCNVLMMQIQVKRSEISLEKGARQELLLLEETFSQLLYRFREMADELGRSTMVHSALRRQEGRSHVTYQLLFRLTDELREYAKFEIFNKEGVCQYTTDNTEPAGKMEPYWGILHAAGTSEELVIQREKKDGGLEAAKAIRTHDGKILGYVVISMEQSNFDLLFSGCYSTSNSIILMDTHWNAVYLTQPALQEELVPELRGQRLRGGDLVDLFGESNYMTLTDEETGFTLVLRQPKIFTAPVKNTVYFLSVVMGVLSLVLCLWGSWMLSRYLAHPVKRLSAAMKEVRKGNYDVTIHTSRVDEFGHLSDSFNRMTKEYRENVERRVQDQKELNATQIRMLQAQLNPHFLYNTLDSIKWMGLVHKAPDVADMATDLAALLRASISGNEFIPLSEELELIERYIEIQSIRFEDRFTCEIDIGEQFQSCQVPKMVLQPLVENAIIHGVAEQEDGYIKISAKEEKGELLILVSDNGCGMPREVLEQLREGYQRLPGEHLGLYNVSSIIRLHYGETYGLTIESEPGNGSCISLRLPMQKGERNAEGGSN